MRRHRPLEVVVVVVVVGRRGAHRPIRARSRALFAGERRHGSFGRGEESEVDGVGS
jgi:hypothetical protein